MENAIITIADQIANLDKLKNVLEEIQNRFEQFGNYEKRLLANQVEPTNVHITTLQHFLTEMRAMVKNCQQFEQQTKVDLPVSISSLYTDIRDTIYRAGKYEEGGINQNPNGIKISAKNIYLGRPPGLWTKHVQYILSKWNKLTEFNRDIAIAYSVEAYHFIRNYFVLIKQINVLQENMKKLNLL